MYIYFFLVISTYIIASWNLQIELLGSSGSADVRVAASVGVGDQDVGQLAGGNRREPDARSLLDLGHGLTNDVLPSRVTCCSQKNIKNL